MQRSFAKSGLAYAVTGQGDPVVFIHGVGLRAECWGAQVNALENDFRVYCIDLPGHGHSPEISHFSNTSIASLSTYTDIVQQFVRAEIGQPATIVGHSLGAMIALQYAISYPEDSSAVVAVSAVFNRDRASLDRVRARADELSMQHVSDVATSPLNRWFVEPDSELEKNAYRQCKNWLENANRSGYATAYKVFASIKGIEADELTRITTPVLLLTGSGDVNSSPAMSDQMQQLIVDSKVVIIPQARHMLQMTHAEQFNQSLLGFMRDLQVKNPGLVR